MGSRWDRFNKRYAEEYGVLKNVLTITIYGSYYPDSEKQFLVRQRNFLRKAGYTKTKLVVDYESNPKTTPLDKSIRCLEYSDVNFLIFTREGKNQGVTRELTHVATSNTMIDKIPFCTVFDETRDKNGSISDLSINDMENSNIVRREFQSEEELQKALRQQAFAKTRILKDVLKKRR